MLERIFVTGGIVLAATCGLVPAVHALEVTDILAMLARVERSSATFEETRTIAALTVPLVRHGSLHYVRPGRLEMTVDAPIRERILIDGDRLTIAGRNGTKEILLSDIPAAAAWVESVRATLSGDAVLLGRYFRVRATGELSQWTLELTPVEQDASAVVARMKISGAQAQLSRIEIDERGGDRSVMLIAPADRKR